jgi:hypothetical protein
MSLPEKGYGDPADDMLWRVGDAGEWTHRELHPYHYNDAAKNIWNDPDYKQPGKDQSARFALIARHFAPPSAVRA